MTFGQNRINILGTIALLDMRGARDVLAKLSEYWATLNIMTTPVVADGAQDVEDIRVLIDLLRTDLGRDDVDPWLTGKPEMLFRRSTDTLIRGCSYHHFGQMLREALTFKCRRAVRSEDWVAIEVATETIHGEFQRAFFDLGFRALYPSRAINAAQAVRAMLLGALLEDEELLLLGQMILGGTLKWSIVGRAKGTNHWLVGVNV